MFELGKILLYIHSTIRHTCVVAKSCRQTPKNAPTTGKTVFHAKYSPQNGKISCLCSHVWQNVMLKLHPILLYNHLGVVYTCTAAKFGAQTAGLTRAMSTRPMLPKRIRAGQSENELSPGFKTKNYS